MREIIVESIVLVTLRRLSHEIIVVVSTDDAVDKRRSLQRGTASLPVITEMQRDTAITRQGIELANGAMDKFVAPADKTHAVSGCICDLAVAYIHRALTCIQPISTDIVDQRIAQYKFLEINRRRVATYTKISTVDLAMVQDIVMAFCSEDHPAPLSGNAVVGLIAEHIAQSVATEFYGRPILSFSTQGSVHDEARCGMKIQSRTRRQRKCTTFFHDQAI